MGDSSGGISGLGVAATTVGGLFVWSAIRNTSPVDTLKNVLGKPNDARPISTGFGSAQSGVRGVVDAGVSLGASLAGASGLAGAAAAGSSVAGVIQASALVSAAEKYLGVRYVFGGVSRSGIDCSGLVVLSFRDIGIKAPRFVTATFGSWAKGQGAKKVTSNFKAGDVVCRSGHMGIALGAGRLIHAPHTGTVVKEANMWDLSNWWAWRFWG
jgi:cell wall-associated NlpC family hydrolase